MPASPFDNPSTHIPRGDWIIRPGDRAFNVIQDMVTQIDLVYIAGCQLFGWAHTPDMHGKAECAQFDAEVRYAFQGLAQGRLTGVPVLGLKIGFYEKHDVENDPNFTCIEGHDTQSFVLGFMLSAFVLFYESQLAAVEQKYGMQKSDWPDVINFARIVRNATAHGGEIHITNPNARAITWHHISITPDHNGLAVAGRDALAVGDLFLLVKEFSDALD